MTKSKVILKIIVFQLMALSFLLAWTNIYSESQTVKHEMKVDLSWIGISSHKLTSLDVKSISGKQVFFHLLSKHLHCFVGWLNENETTNVLATYLTNLSE